LPIVEASSSDLDEIALLVNAAYRSGEGWTHEADLIEGQRTSRADLERELSTPEPAVILCLREDKTGLPLACVLLRKKADHFYLGMLSVSPDAMDRGFGRTLLEYSESYARERGASRMVMTVLSVRDTLIAWYQRRGYRPTGDSIPFPYENKGLGRPLSPALNFAVLEKHL
jgi:ribosomal protein S18 acetylase RimI-like enzyme